jgi:nucleoside-diphosphate-sugar epimerase
MSVLVTGAGFLGSYTAKECSENGEDAILYELTPNYAAINAVCGKEVQIIKGDILNIKELQKVMSRYHPKKIVHTVAIRQTEAQKDPIKARKINIEGTKNVIKVANSVDARIVYTSSASVYGSKIITDRPIKEDYKLRPMSIYAKTKAESERLILNYSNSVILRFPGLFGPYKGRTSTGNEIFRKIIEAAILGQKKIVNNPFKNLIEHVYIKDAAHAIILALKARNLKNRIFNIGMGRVHTMDEVLAIIRKLNFDADIKLRYVPSSIDVRNQPLDITLSKEQLGYFPRFNLESALIDYIKTLSMWIKN